MHISIGPEATHLPDEPEVRALIESAAPDEVARRHPQSPLAWARLAELAWTEGRELDSYAYARVGYHRGLDALRRAGWRGKGPVPASHEPNRGFLQALHCLGRAAAAIGETAEVDRISAFLDECDPSAREIFDA
ncbi:DUF3151 domain-containing protein [Flaviflexus salsibiostraticola]|uniref:DUF3151 domain-containing protein n=1 Tax=Flaviflexus salsibiostraticola TaxID=1282737 RepID=A0A3S8Z666_9ACTO|nr:DUF3151 domain-containing protein [Flaviflexus salsibiostraticola]AZN28933.1 DUF3151 domain-containing protein [Flaviflexus salsibiostraticola]